MIEESGTTSRAAAARVGWRHAATRWARLHAGTVEAVAAIPIAAVLFLLYHHLTATIQFNSDFGFLPLQAADVLNGNPTARGWVGPQDTFFFTELPVYVVAVALHGLSPTLVNIVSAAYYTLTVLTVVAIARAGLPRRDRLLAMLVAFALVVAPAYPDGVRALLPGPGHLGTALVVLLAVLCLHAGHRRARVPLCLVALVLLTLDVASDPLALFAGAVPIALVHGLRLAGRLPGGLLDDGPDFGIAALSILLGVLGGRAFYAAIGYHVYPVPAAFVTLSAIPGQIAIALDSWLPIFGAQFLGQPLTRLTGWQLFRLLGYVFTVAGCGVVAAQTVRAVRRQESHGAGDPLVLSQLLLAVVIVNVAAAILSTNSFAVGNGRYLVPAILAGAAIAGRVAPGILSRVRWRAAAAAVCVCYIALLPLSLRYPAAPLPESGVAAWLQAHHLHHGLAGYWSASDITVMSGDRVQVRAVANSDGKVGPLLWVVRKSWYGPDASANFVLIDKSDPTITPDTATATFGAPASVAQVDGVTVMVWDHNLLPELGSART